MNPILLRYAGVALVAAIFGGIGGSYLTANNGKQSSPPEVVISDIITQPRLGWAVIYWSTDVPTNRRVDYGTTESYGQVFEELYSPSIKHKAYLTGIGEGTYHFRITATDPKTGKSVMSSDQTVKTYPIVDVGYPAIVGCKNELRIPEDYQHIQAALDASCAGGTVYVGPGEYRENVSTWGGVSLIGAGASKTIIRGPGSGNDGGPDLFGGVVYLAAGFSTRDGKFEYIMPTLSGFTITSDYVKEAGIQNQAYAYEGSVGVAVSTGPSEKLATIKNNVFKHLDMGVLLIQYDQPVAILNNTFVGGRGQDYAVMMAFGGGSPSGYPSTLIENNVITDYEKAGVWIMCPGTCDFLRPTDFTIQYNNTWRNTKDYLFTQNLTERVYPTVNSPRWSYYLSKIMLPIAKTQYDPTGKNGNISANPLFVNFGAGDYHERIGSPHVDAGNPASAFSFEPQPNGGRINMGAYGNTSEAALSR